MKEEQMCKVFMDYIIFMDENYPEFTPPIKSIKDFIESRKEFLNISVTIDFEKEKDFISHCTL